MRETLLIPKPHGTKQNIVMKAFLIEGLTELWVACGSKFGKSYGGTAGLSARAWTKKNGLYRWVAPIYNQTKIGFNYCKRMLPPEPLTSINRSEPSIWIPKLDTRMQFLSGKFPEDLEGEAVDGYGLDECAKMKEQVYDSAKTTTTVTRGPIAGFSTPRGKNWFYKKCMRAKEEMEWSLKKGITPTKLFITAPSIDNPAVTAEAVMEAKRSLPDRLFRQYFLAEFIDDGSVFVGFRDCIEGDEELVFAPGRGCFWIDPQARSREENGKRVGSDVVIGADWAKHTDWTVFIAIDYNAPIPKIVGFARFQGLNYTQAVRELYQFAKNFKSVGIIKHDKTGVGEAIDEMLGNIPLNCQGVTFNNANKAAMVNSLMLTFERRGLILPNWPEMLAELDAFEVIVSESGNMKYNAPSGMHDDIVISICLAMDACQEYAGIDFRVRVLEDLPATELSIDRYYQDLISDSGDDDLELFNALR